MAFDLSKFADSIQSLRPRTIETVTEEILDIKQRIGADFLDLGRRLIEARELLSHGEWTSWLEREVDFSERTAQRFMTLAREYDDNPDLAAQLGSTRAFALLAVPEEKREEIVQHGVEVDGKTKAVTDLTSREIQRIAREEKERVAAEAEPAPAPTAPIKPEPEPKTDSAVVFEPETAERADEMQARAAYAWVPGSIDPEGATGWRLVLIKSRETGETNPFLFWWDLDEQKWYTDLPDRFRANKYMRGRPDFWVELPPW